MDRDDLVKTLQENNMVLASLKMLPVKIHKEMFTFAIEGINDNKEVLAAVLNGLEIDTSDSIDKTTGELLIFDV